MTLSETLVIAATTAYLLSFLAILLVAGKFRWLRRLSQHPATQTLALGVFASAWSLYGSSQLALEYGYGAFAYYLGTGTLFLFAPLALAPLAELCRRYQLQSLADLLVFRYHSNSAGQLATLFLALALMPLLAAQLQSLSLSYELITHGNHYAEDSIHSNDFATLGFAVLVLIISLIAASKQHYSRLPLVLAADTIVKIFAFNAIGLLAIFAVFGGFDQLDNWLLEHPENVNLLYSPLRETSSHTLLLVFIASSLITPNLFHSAVIQQPRSNIRRILPWAFPTLLLLFAFPIFPVLWAGFERGVLTQPEFFALGLPISMERPAWTLIMFIAGASASATALITILISLSTMVVNHCLLPMTGIRRGSGLSKQLKRLQQIAICCLMIITLGLYSLWQGQHSLTELALLSFIAGAQFVPGLIAISYWPSGNRQGFLAGLSAGAAIWLLGLAIPTLFNIKSINLGYGPHLQLGLEHWDTVALLSLTINSLIFAWVSYRSQATAEEVYSAELCAENELSQPKRSSLDVFSVSDVERRLSSALGNQPSREAISKALSQLKLDENERRPYALRRLRDQLEANLSGILGVNMAQEIISKYIPLRKHKGSSTDVTFMEERLEQNQNKLVGLPAELNNLRLYHRQTLQELPMAVCSIGQDLEIVLWNKAMGYLTRLAGDKISGSHLNELPPPWGPIIRNFYHSGETHWANQEVEIDGQPHWISLHVAKVQTPMEGRAQGTVILLEDVTETHRLEQELMHNERLASVGRLAAGVAHEIGNPVTGIACLAQNLRYETEPEDTQETVSQILSQTDRITRIVQSLVNFSHTGQSDQSQLQSIQIRECVAEAIHLLELHPEKQELQFINKVSEQHQILGDSQRLIQVFINLLSNARDASPAGAEVTVEAEPSKEQLILRVTDQGPGVPEAIMERILEPFFTTKDPGEGTGLGLAMVYSIMEEHSGSVEIRNLGPKENPSGAQFILKFPLKP
ncbi:MAG: ATP-binding protein [Cellvibrionaceae bacterium]|nr:ATP-binding protein [Cellvibrionaceae bacterium]